MTSASAIDPTKNVMDMVGSEVRRLNDVAALRAQLTEEQIRRIEDKSDHVKEIGELRAKHQMDLDGAESGRLNAIRQVDVLAVNTAADRALAAIQALAASNDAQAKALAKQLEDALRGVNEKISTLEKSSYEGKGRQGATDPAMERLAERMESLLESRSAAAGRSAGVEWSFAKIVALVGVFAAALGVAAAVTKIIG